MQPRDNIVEDCFDWPTARTLQGAFPDLQDPPSGSGETGYIARIARFVALDFRRPELSPRRWQLEQRAVMAMPETAMHQDCGTITREHYVRTAGEVFPMQPVAQAPGM